MPEISPEQFLRAEAHLLNQGDFTHWLALLDDDFDYRILNSVARDDPFRTRYNENNVLAWESIHSLKIRFDRMLSEFAWADRPIGFQRRHVTAVRVLGGDGSADADLVVESDVLVARSRRPDVPSMVSAVRTDILRPRGDGYQLVKRVVCLDLDQVGAAHLALIY